MKSVKVFYIFLFFITILPIITTSCNDDGSGSGSTLTRVIMYREESANDDSKLNQIIFFTNGNFSFRPTVISGSPTKIITGYYRGNPKLDSTDITLFVTGNSSLSKVTPYQITATVSGTTISFAYNDNSLTLFKNGIKTHYIKFNINGGTLPSGVREIPNLEAQKNVSTLLPSVIPLKTGNTFYGWAQTAFATVSDPIFPPSSYYTLASDSEVTLYAVYIPTLPLKYSTNGTTFSTIDNLATFNLSTGNYAFSGTITQNSFETIMKKVATATGEISLDFSSCEGPVFEVAEGSASLTLCGSTSSTTINKTLVSFTPPPNLSNIPSYAFYNCAKLATVSLSASQNLTAIGSRAFYGCKALSTLSIGESITNISTETSSFIENSGVTSITVDSNNPNFTATNGVLFNKDSSILLSYPPQKSDTTYTIPSTVTTISNGAFCSSYKLSDSDEWTAFDTCPLTTLIIPSSVTVANSRSAPNTITTLTLNEGLLTISDAAFANCKDLTSLVIPNTVTTIKKSAFEGCVNLATLTIGSAVEVIGERAFSQTSLTTVNIPSTLSSIQSGAFIHCDNLASFVTNPGNTNYCSVDGVLYQKNSDGDPVALIKFPPKLQDSASSTAITTFTIPSTVTTIKSWAFESCTSLTSLVIPNTVTTIETSTYTQNAWQYSPFLHCSSSLSITCQFSKSAQPDSWGSSWNAFDRNKNLTVNYQ